MPTGYVDMDSDELTYDGGSELSTIFKYAAIGCAIVAAAGLAMCGFSSIGFLTANEAAQNVFANVLLAGCYTSAAGTAGAAVSLIGWGWDASLTAATKH